MLSSMLWFYWQSIRSLILCRLCQHCGLKAASNWTRDLYISLTMSIQSIKYSLYTVYVPVKITLNPLILRLSSSESGPTCVCSNASKNVFKRNNSFFYFHYISDQWQKPTRLKIALKEGDLEWFFTGKGPLPHRCSFIQLGGYNEARWRHCWRMLRSRMWYLVSIYIYERSLHCSWGESRHSSVEQTEAQNYCDIHPSCSHSCKWQQGEMVLIWTSTHWVPLCTGYCGPSSGR